MKRIGLVALCLGAMGAFGAMAASWAYAGEYGECVKAPLVNKRYTGHFTDAGCEKAATGKQIEEGKVNRYNWQMVGATDKPFTDTDTKATLKSAVGEIVCTKSKSVGEILGWQKNKERITFEGCAVAKSKPKLTCSSAGEPSGTIWSNTLDTYLIDHGTKGPSGLEPKENEVWNEFESSEHEPYLAEFECGGLKIGVLGTVSGVVSPLSKMVLSSKVKFAATIGEQDLLLEANKETIPATLTTTETIKYKSKVEIRPCNEVGAKPEGKEVLTCEHEELPLPWEHGVG